MPSKRQRSGGGAAVAPDRSGPLERFPLLWAWLCGALTTTLSALVSDRVFGRIAHVQDSIAQLFQARIFAGGHLWVPSHPMPQFFEYMHMINDGRWYSQYPPGHPALLALGVWAGAPWLVNPILAGLGVVGVYLLANELFDRGVARLAALLGALSPFLVVMGGGFMSHVGAFTLLTFFLFLHFRSVRTQSRRDAALAAACLGSALLIRPYTAAVVAVPAVAHGLWTLRRDYLRLGVWIAAGGAIGLVVYGLYNWATTGDPFLPGYIKLNGPAHGLGFGKGLETPHTLRRGLEGAWLKLQSLNFRLFEWPVTSLWPLVVALLPAFRPAPMRPARDRSGALKRPRPEARLAAGDAVGPAERRGRTGLHACGRAWLLFCFPAAILVAYVFYWYHDLCFGPRYLYEGLGPILTLSAYGVLRLHRWIRREDDTPTGGSKPTGDSRPNGGSRSDAAAVLAGFRRLPRWLRAIPVPLILALQVGYAGAVGIPRLFHLPESGLPYFRYFGTSCGSVYWGVSPHLGRLVKRRGLHHALVFVRIAESPSESSFRRVWFGSAMTHQSPYLSRAEVIYAEDRGPEDVELARFYPDREIYLYEGGLETGTLRRVR
jgi:hypothetical protein